MKDDSSVPARRAKQALRREMRARLREWSPAARAEASLRLCQLAAHLPEFAGADNIALFAPLPSEPDISLLIEKAWADGKQVALSRVKMEEKKPVLEWFIVSAWSELLENGPFGLREPNAGLCLQMEVKEFDCAFVPGLAFDEKGFRLGRGGGYYDCFLAEAPSRLPCIGLMFSCQAVAKVPREPHDTRLRSVLTEEGLRIFG
ncbi:MAG TPA: 5-formyltetrahydrofolate cyclo-ligase [Candidatus Methylacidiphilales bacterium]|nr:5-formyltetrahydrofolate cyclo-ligase [Candidatus Methylacidiphilales bacterium]